MSFFSSLRSAFTPPERVALQVVLGETPPDQIEALINTTDGKRVTQCEIVVDAKLIDQGEQTGMLACVDALARTPVRVQKFLGRVSIRVNGHPEELTKLRAVPAVRTWFRTLHDARPFFLVFLAPPSNGSYVSLSIKDPSPAELQKPGANPGALFLANISTLLTFAGRDVRTFLKANGVDWRPVWDTFLEQSRFPPERRQMIMMMMDAIPEK